MDELNLAPDAGEGVVEDIEIRRSDSICAIQWKSRYFSSGTLPNVCFGRKIGTK